MEPGSTPRLWIKISLGDRGQVGPGKIRLLQSIAAHRSISAAARAEGMSYRRAWLLVDQMNKTFGRPVLRTHTGGNARGGAALTELGAEVVARYEALLRLAQDQSAETLEHFAALIRTGD
ncbi:MAG: LysR family transcriptional regulator [Chromatiales bacterium]|jgi:molybdate transport system regulatory protein